MTKKIRIKPLKLCVSLLILIIVFPILAVLGDRIFYEKRLSSIPSENEDVPAFFINGSLYLETEEYDLFNACRKLGYDLQEVLCISPQNAYIICETTTKWMLAAVSLPTMKLDVLYEFLDPACDYCCSPSASLMMKNGFYYNGKIILNDRKHISSYDLISKEAEVFLYSEFDFSEHEYIWKVIDNETIELTSKNITKRLTLGDMADGSSSILRIYQLKSGKKWDGSSCVGSFFSESSIQRIGNESYIVGSCMSFLGESYAILFHYNQLNDIWEYINYYYSGDIVDNECYVVAEIGEDWGGFA